MIPTPRATIAVLALASACGPEALSRVTGTIGGPSASGVSLVLRGAVDQRPVQYTRSDAAGRYAFDDVQPGAYSVIPYLEGSRFVPPRAPVSLTLRASGEVNFSSTPVLQVRAQDLSAGHEALVVLHAGVEVTDALVHVNGEVIPHGPGGYSGPMGTVMAVGQAVHLEVSWSGASVVGDGLMPETPVLEEPAAGASLSPEADLMVSWTSGTDPDRFTVLSQWDAAGYHHQDAYTVDGSIRAFTVPASDLPSEATVAITVCAYVEGALSGDYEPFARDPGMSVRAATEARDVKR